VVSKCVRDSCVDDLFRVVWERKDRCTTNAMTLHSSVRDGCGISYVYEYECVGGCA
jgi:hypothetical protein